MRLGLSWIGEIGTDETGTGEIGSELDWGDWKWDW